MNHLNPKPKGYIMSQNNYVMNCNLIGFELGLIHDQFNVDLIDYNGIRLMLLSNEELMQACIDGFNEAKQVKGN